MKNIWAPNFGSYDELRGENWHLTEQLALLTEELADTRKELAKANDQVTRYYEAYADILGYVEELEEKMATTECLLKRKNRLITWLVKENGHD